MWGWEIVCNIVQPLDALALAWLTKAVVGVDEQQLQPSSSLHNSWLKQWWVLTS